MLLTENSVSACVAFTLGEAFVSLVDMALAGNLRGRASRVPEFISSRENRWLKQFRAALAGEKQRDAAVAGSGEEVEAVGLEGPHLVETALRAGLAVPAVLVSESGARHLQTLGELIPASTRLISTSDRVFAQVAATEAPQGIAALAQPRRAAFDDLVGGVPLLLVMAAVQDPGNLGTLLRTAEAFGASGAVTCSAGGIGSADAFGPKALRASAGSALRLPILRGVAAPILLTQLRVAGIRVYASSPGAEGSEGVTAAVAPWQVNWRQASALLVGNEGAGLPAELLRSSDAVVCIPQATVREAGAPVESLNAAVAGAILLYEAARQRGLG